MRISEIARRSGIPATTLRYYEDIGLIPPPRRINGRRVYDESVFERIKIIQIAKNAGFALDEIYNLLQDEESLSIRMHQFITQKLIGIRQLIEHYRNIEQRLVQGLLCECDSVHDCDQFA